MFSFSFFFFSFYRILHFIRIIYFAFSLFPNINEHTQTHTHKTIMNEIEST